VSATERLDPARTALLFFMQRIFPRMACGRTAAQVVGMLPG